ncbi:hypothetical protein EJF18_10511 [Clavispora lusitaniae]|uniref:Uncharacterized protein n=1 Tax=Clavispora lusitaniae TaxID=36911 RepID=A0ACD0WDF5_CLALS|nr:hypothetical protein EJF14_10511 [Clavispora lusitaniae]QFZ31281.1 hypothetical protein EJF16_10511 [Clavispora lusitaniae]QFZ36949.1 hypothetical protein EJF15_10511 [Clavispora lusitaniae]QFZ42633.1 hypothetical protein EJF18_10511 [Clavispora lusitaniae]QFZ48309.1 hypothetical protein EJF17_10511 [Clavispora lusitaniae]
MGTTLPLGVFTEDRPMEDHSASASASAKWISLRKQSSAKETLVSIPRISFPTMASWVHGFSPGRLSQTNTSKEA